MACVLAYAVVASAAASLFVPDSPTTAGTVGALLGALGFAVYNITIRSYHKNPLHLAVIDTAYGTASWTLLMCAQHYVRAA